MLRPALLLVCICGVFADTDLVASESIETGSPLAKLLATASGVKGPILPLAPEHFRPKRKPQRFALSGDRPRFKLRGRKPIAPADTPEANEIPATEQPPRKKFNGFARRGRPSPSRFQPAIQDTTDATQETVLPTEAPKFQLEDFFGTPEPVKRVPVSNAIREEVVETERALPLPIPLSNSVGNERNILDEVKARTIAITGAQPVGVTKDITHRSKGARKLSSAHRDGARKKVGRRPTKVIVEEEPELDRSEEIEVDQPRNSLVLNPNRVGGLRKKKVVRKGHSVGTVERYRYENEDGGITWGYENEDGSYKEEVIGKDCVTRGKYGYIDPSGEVREYSYTSGVPCDPLTRKIASDQSASTGANGHGFYDYAHNKFVMPDGRRVRVVVNQSNKARGRRY